MIWPPIAVVIADMLTTLAVCNLIQRRHHWRLFQRKQRLEVFPYAHLKWMEMMEWPFILLPRDKPVQTHKGHWQESSATAQFSGDSIPCDR
jgi:hypothetical protein